MCFCPELPRKNFLRGFACPEVKVKPKTNKKCYFIQFFNTNILYLRNPLMPALFYKHLCHSLIDSVDDLFFRISRHCLSQPVRSRELKFWENVHPLQYVMCHMSGVTCQLSCARCHVSGVKYHIFFGQIGRSTWSGSVINEAYPV